MLPTLTQLAQTSSYYTTDYSTSTTGTMSAGATMGILLVGLVFGLVLYVLIAICYMKLFKKAGHKNAWAAWVPLYNMWVYFEVAGRPGWWAFLSLISPINIVLGFIGGIDMAKSFGKDSTFGIVMLGLFPFIGVPMLAFGKSAYVGPAGPEGNSAAAAPTAPTADPVAQMQQPTQQFEAPVAQQQAPEQPAYTQPPVGGVVEPPAPVDEVQPPTPPVGPLVQ